jgi:hypothetical protein
VRLDRHRLELVSKAQLGEDGVEELRHLVTIYAERNTEQGVKSFWSPADITPVQQQEPTALQALVEAVWFVWRERGGSGHGGRWDKDKHKHGAFVRLLQELFDQAGIRKPSARTFRRALQSVHEETDDLLKAAYQEFLRRDHD